MKKTMQTTAASILLSASILGACSNNETANVTESAAVKSPAATSAPEATVIPEATVTPEATESSDPQAAGRPETKAFGEQEGGVAGQKGTLARGEGFTLYLFNGFGLDAKKGRVSLMAAPDYYADIEPLPSGYDLAALKQQGETELSASGTPKDYSGELVEHPLGFAELYLQVSGENGSEDYIVWKNQAGDAYLFRIHNPKSEDSSGFSPWAMVSLSTVEAE
ncbi:hypothetical protein SAMN03159358_1126 [Paenibacillus sp. NFR01]|nr:hypothetical protein SAMN03159358_1126 [Paenibacillus sp. NFR01]